jgi:hypothetical protein
MDNNSTSRSASFLLVLLALLFNVPVVFAQSCPSDMQAVKIGKAVSCVPLKAKVAKASEQLKTDPRFAEWLKGKWDFIHPDNAAPGEFCSAIFQNKDVMIWLLGPGGDYRGALMRFYAPDIPKPTHVDKIGSARQKITLTQAPDPSQTLTVMTHAYNEFKHGVLTVPVPNLDALLGAMTDSNQFKIDINGREVINVIWRDGLRARDALKKCSQNKL